MDTRTNPDPDRQALDTDAGPDPAKWCRSDGSGFGFGSDSEFGSIAHFFSSALSSAGEDVISVDPSIYTSGFAEESLSDLENNSQVSSACLPPPKHVWAYRIRIC